MVRCGCWGLSDCRGRRSIRTARGAVPTDGAIRRSRETRDSTVRNSAAGAVAAKDVEPWAVVGGNPAKFIKMRVLKA